jgi:hypothetical protein
MVRGKPGRHVGGEGIEFFSKFAEVTEAKN